MQSKQETITEMSDEAIPIFTQYPHRYNCYTDTLEGFNEFFANKPVGYWLIRESRINGMITLMHKLDNNKVMNSRYAFVNGQWQWMGIKTGDKPYDKIYVHSIKSKFQLLLETLYARHPLDAKKMIRPAVGERTSNTQYYSSNGPQYVNNSPNQEKEKPVYANPIQALERIKTIMTLLGATLAESGTDTNNLKMTLLFDIKMTLTKEQLTQILRETVQPFKNNKNAEEIKNLFEQWLEANGLTDDLLCPVSYSLFSEPYLIGESGMIYDADSLFVGGKCLATCPKTRLPIELHPTHFEGYRGILYTCLEQFFDLIMMYQEQMKLDLSRVSDSSLAMSSATRSTFFSSKPSSSNDDDAEPSNEAMVQSLS